MASEQISVSRETLRAELGELKLSFSESLAALELRLLDRLAEKAELRALEVKIEALERLAVLKDGPIAKRVDELHISVHDLEGESAARSYLIEDYKATRLEVVGLVRWRNKILGGLGVVGSAAAMNVAHIWFGIG